MSTASFGELRPGSKNRAAILTAALLFGAPSALRAEEALCQDCNVVVICFDTLRSDRLGSQGYRREVTPNLDAFARKSFFFSNAVSQSAWTLPSIMTVFTSLYPHQHAVTNKYAVFLENRKELSRLPLSIMTMAESFKAAGYRTAGFTGGSSLAGYHGFSDGFDVYRDSYTFAGFDRTFPAALEWIERNRKKKTFVFVQGYDAHGQYDRLEEQTSRFYDPAYEGPFRGTRDEFLGLRMKTIKGEPIEMTPEDAQVWRDRYDEQVLQADARLGDFLRRLEEIRGRRKPTVVVIFSDHGEQFYDHGGFDHGMTLHEEIIHVPLVVHVPGRGSKRIDAQVGLIDLFPTLSKITGAPPPGQLKGRDLTPFMKDSQAPEGQPFPSFAETDFLLHTFKRALRTPDGWKLISDVLAQEKELYHLANDPHEKKDLKVSEPALLSELEMKLDAWAREGAQ